MLQGKGLWAYRGSEELNRAILIAPQMEATHILYKVAQGATYYPGMAQVAQRITAAGLIPFAWIWLLLDDPQAEAQAVVRAFQDGFQGFIFDTESDKCRNRFEQAAQLGQYLSVAGVDPNRLYNCSFPNISQHRDLPYDQMNVYCKGGLMPMSYGTLSYHSDKDPEVHARQVIDEYTYGHYEYWCQRWGYCPPLYPILAPYHDEYASVRMPPAEFQMWLDLLAAHGPAFFSVYRAGVLNDDLLPSIRTFSLGGPPKPVSIGIKVDVVSPDVGYVNVRPSPSTEKLPIARANDGTVLEALEPEATVKAKIGQQGRWLRVRTPVSVEGYVAAWYLQLHREEAPVKPVVKVRVVSPELGFLNVRPAPSTAQPSITQADDGVVLEPLEPEESVRAKVGQAGQWLHVRTAEGIEGYVAAQYLRLYEEVPAGGPVSHVVVYSNAGLNVRQGPGDDTPILWHVEDRTVLEACEEKVGDKVGKDQWLKVRTPSLHEGYVNSLYVRAQQQIDTRAPASNVSPGECAWLFGIHAAGASTPADFRFLFQGTGKTGWVLFTEAIGADPNDSSGHDYTTWSDGGYGVIVRLNHDYPTSGTLPVRTKYADFAARCARYAQNSKGCHIWIIGNEQNNAREHPGGADNPIEHITPELYAEAFNLARQRIRAVQPTAFVVPGAVDPYNTYPWVKLGGKRNRPLEYFKTMLSAIDNLDGIALHTYTHWMDVSLITSKHPFQDPPLEPKTPNEHYYDFQAYRPFAEAIPAKWRDRPIFITESNHWIALDREPANEDEKKRIGWLNRDMGWVQAAYAEINRWNNMPYAQQIHCLLLYRWTGDEWAIEGLGEIHKDFKKALANDYRWRR